MSIFLVFLVAIFLVMTGITVAVQPGKTLEFSGGEEGKVVFSGDVHGPKAGLKCSDCHPKPFAFKKGSFKMSKDDHGKPDYCGKCHDGNEHFNKVVFSQSKEENCVKCHKKEEPKKEEPIKKEEDK